MFTDKNIKSSVIEIITISFLFGVIGTIIVYNILDKEILEFSTLGLITFVLSIIFGGASLVLAITAINLGRTSENEISRRGAESIDAQNQILQKNLEVLAEIKTSTGVTEKRMEDILAGRAKIAAENISMDKNMDVEEITKSIQESLRTDISPERKKIAKEREIAKENYDKYHKNLLSHISKIDDIQIHKNEGHGTTGGKGLDLFDGVFTLNDKKFALSIYAKEKVLEGTFIYGLDGFYTRIYEEISSGNIDYFFYVGEVKNTVYSKLKEKIKTLSPLFKGSINESIHILSGDEQQLEKQIISTLK